MPSKNPNMSKGLAGRMSSPLLKELPDDAPAAQRPGVKVAPPAAPAPAQAAPAAPAPAVAPSPQAMPASPAVAPEPALAPMQAAPVRKIAKKRGKMNKGFGGTAAKFNQRRI